MEFRSPGLGVIRIKYHSAENRQFVRERSPKCAQARAQNGHRGGHHVGNFEKSQYFQWYLAETEGFEPSVGVIPLRRFSKPLVSATHPRLRRSGGGYSRQGAAHQPTDGADGRKA